MLLQSVSNLPMSGESLKVLARDLGNRVYTKCSISQKGQDLMVEKLASVYSGYTDLLAKDTQVENGHPVPRIRHTCVAQEIERVGSIS